MSPHAEPIGCNTAKFVGTPLGSAHSVAQGLVSGTVACRSDADWAVGTAD